MQKPKGTLISIGGNEDKGFGADEAYRLEFISDGILSHVVQQGGGTDARIVVIPTASSIPDEVSANYIHAFTKLGCKKVKVLKIKSRKSVDKEKYLERLRKADIVMFSGGDQRKLSRIFTDSQALDILHDRYLNDAIVIAGTSAGAVGMSETMIFGGSAAYSMKKGAVKLMNGLGFMPGIIFDSHFIVRGRFGRLAEAVAHHPHLLGVGLGEDTGIMIKNGNECQVLGSGMVIVFDGSKFSHNSVADLEEETPISIGNLIVHV
ncbi:MAG: cyanophycinase, partial [Saprospiraceae bacterium]|nr:cyanophycinase [Saprospiraceae bacterium]